MLDNVFCIDLEDWFHQSLIPASVTDRSPRIESNTERLLELFDEAGATATFFALGQVAERHGALLRRIQAAGHEIACHGYTHAMITSQTPPACPADVTRAKAQLEDVCGISVKGYRAPSWTITKKTLWALEVLQEAGFVYDSSIFPVENFLYGIPDAPRFPHQRTVNGRPFWEIPPSTFSILGKNMGFSGGFYLRVLPAAAIRHFTNRINQKGQPAIFYLHPVEIDQDCPRVPAPLRDRLILYWGIDRCEEKVRRILHAFSFTSIEKRFRF